MFFNIFACHINFRVNKLRTIKKPVLFLEEAGFKNLP
jgi:hypothetical protein